MDIQQFQISHTSIYIYKKCFNFPSLFLAILLLLLLLLGQEYDLISAVGASNLGKKGFGANLICMYKNNTNIPSISVYYVETNESVILNVY